EYWYYILANILIVISFYIIIFASAFFLGPMAILTIILIVLFGVANIIPNLAVIVRRLHDTNKSGWWVLLSLIPLGGLVLLIFYCIEGDHGDNQYGTDPKDLSKSEINQMGRS
ncbi:MAG: DUF805 domain-containing protein, partial [Flavobacteriaceae bacterium]|nr:DUF805 domain-containing protein [Flavobacteriaceae bacterium]